MKKTIRDYDLNNKKVIIRCDFNVPMKDGKITDDNRIRESLETIKYAIDNNAKVILMSHLGRVKTEEDKKDKSLKAVSDRLSDLLKRPVTFINVTRGEKLELAINNMKPQDVLLIENTRYEDVEGKKESGNDLELGKYWASLGDIFINDAFGTCHRAHASNVGIASHLPSGIGFLVEKELNILGNTLENPKRPFAVILGGSKVNDKIKVIENLVTKADYILIGGGMAFTFLQAKDIEIGKSILDEENISFCKEIMSKYPDKIILPIDTVCSKKIDEDSSFQNKFITDLKTDDIGLDIGFNTVKLFCEYLNECKTVIWNGPVGMCEIKNYQEGTRKLCEFLSKLDSSVIIGGGDTAAAVISLVFKDSFTHISTGGGASLELMEGKILPGVDIINDK